MLSRHQSHHVTDDARHQQTRLLMLAISRWLRVWGAAVRHLPSILRNRWAVLMARVSQCMISCRACLYLLIKWSMIVTSSTADRDHWSRSVVPPSVAQYAKLPEWDTVLAVWQQLRTVSRQVGGGRSWLRFGVIYSPTLAAATDSLLPTFPLSPCGVKRCAGAVTTDTQTVQRGCADRFKLSTSLAISCMIAISPVFINRMWSHSIVNDLIVIRSWSRRAIISCMNARL